MDTSNTAHLNPQSPENPAVKSDPARDARRSQLLEAATRCIYQFGLAGTTVARVTKEAGLSAGTVNFYFSSKDQLLTSVLESVRDEFSEAIDRQIDTDSSPEAVIHELTAIHFDPAICGPEKIAVWHAFASARRHRSDYQNICGSSDRRVFDLVVQAFQRLCSTPETAHYDPETLAHGLTGIWDGLWQGRLYEPERFHPDQASHRCQGYLHALFPHVFPVTNPSPELTGSQVPTTHEVSDLLPAWTYASEAFHALEIEQLFKTHWMLAGHISQVANPRDYLTFDGFGERALVVRDEEGELRAFHNVCRHRGARLLEDQGQCRHAITCPFHGWSYDLQGNLIAIPAIQTFENLDPADNPLVPLEMEVWMGFIFVRFSRGPIQGDASMRELMAPVESLIAPYQPENMHPLPGMRYRERRPYNWKVIHDIDNEGYHVPVGHPALQHLYGGNYTDHVVGGIPVSKGYLNDRESRFWSVRQYKNLLPRFEHLPEDNQRLWLYLGIFPNAVIGLYPDSIEYYMTVPDGVSHTWYQGASFGLEDARRETRAARYLSRRINNETEAEDESFVRGLQDGMRSSAFPLQQLSSLEQGVRNFHKAIQSALPVANLAVSPAPEHIRAMNQSLASSDR